MIKLLGDVTDEMRSSADETYNQLGLNGNAIVEVEFVSREDIAELNGRTRGIDRATDVLSYPMLEEIKPFSAENYPFDYDEENEGVFLGSIVICLDVAKAQAEDYGHSVTREYTYLFTHGLLHLLGYDHMTEEEKTEMRKAEESVLSAIGVNR
ncbi:MAG: rRNA maturation RNase YbeY [Clostridia bacterium]|nr:rRNA maturation RNase YbeY [Clostridia bacterium]